MGRATRSFHPGRLWRLVTEDLDGIRLRPGPLRAALNACLIAGGERVTAHEDPFSG